MDDATTRARNVDAITAAFAAASLADVEGQLQHYSHDAVIEIPLSSPPGRYEGRDTLRTLMTYAYDRFPITLEITEIIPCLDPDELVIEYLADGVVTATGKPFVKRYLGRFSFRDGLITRQREFLDPNAMTAAMVP